jgi:hypothetical protein
MLNETSIGNVSFRSMPEGKRVSLRIGGIGLTIQQNTWNDLVRLAEDVGIVQSDVDDNRNVDNSEVIEYDEIEQVEAIEEQVEVVEEER